MFPTSSTYARLAMANAMVAFCSTSRMPMPARWMSRTIAPRSRPFWEKTHAGLVHEQELGRGHQRPAHRQHLLLAPGEALGQLLAPLIEDRERA